MLKDFFPYKQILIGLLYQDLPRSIFNFNFSFEISGMHT